MSMNRTQHMTRRPVLLWSSHASASVPRCPSRVFLPAVASATLSLSAAMVWGEKALAQTMFQCSGGSNEQQVAVTMQGPVTVPLCVSRPAASSQGGARGARDVDPDDDALGGVYIEGPRYGPPRGWRATYGGFMSFVVSQDENGGNEVYDMVLTLGHATPAEAAAAATALCVEKALFPEPSSSCHPQILDRAYYLILQRDTEDGRFELLQFDDPRGFGSDIVRRSADRREVCSRADAPNYPRPCFRLVAYDRNGIWPR